MKDRLPLAAGVVFVIAAIFYTSVMWEKSICYRVPGCPTLRALVLGG